MTLTRWWDQLTICVSHNKLSKWTKPRVLLTSTRRKIVWERWKLQTGEIIPMTHEWKLSLGYSIPRFQGKIPTTSEWELSSYLVPRWHLGWLLILERLPLPQCLQRFHGKQRIVGAKITYKDTLTTVSPCSPRGDFLGRFFFLEQAHRILQRTVLLPKLVCPWSKVDVTKTWICTVYTSRKTLHVKEDRLQHDFKYHVPLVHLTYNLTVKIISMLPLHNTAMV